MIDGRSWKLHKKTNAWSTDMSFSEREKTLLHKNPFIGCAL